MQSVTQMYWLASWEATYFQEIIYLCGLRRVEGIIDRLQVYSICTCEKFLVIPMNRSSWI